MASFHVVCQSKYVDRFSVKSVSVRVEPGAGLPEDVLREMAPIGVCSNGGDAAKEGDFSVSNRGSAAPLRATASWL